MSSSEKNQVLHSYLAIAEEKGWLSKEAAIEPKPELNLDSSGDFNNDLLTLITGLKEKGLHKFAAELEENYFNFKKIQTHLYKVHPVGETDMLEFAHPDGDADVCDASGNLGHVETLISAHEQMLKATKSPALGKVGSSHQVVEMVKIALKKKADFRINEPYKKALIEKYNQYLHNLKFHLAQLVEAAKTLLQRTGVDLLSKLGVKGNYLRIQENINKLEQAIQQENFQIINGIISIFSTSLSKLEEGLSSDWLSKVFKTDISKIQEAKEMMQIRTEINNLKEQLKQMWNLDQKYELMSVKEEKIPEDNNSKLAELFKLINDYKSKIKTEFDNRAITREEYLESSKWLVEQDIKLRDVKNISEVESALKQFAMEWF